MATTLEDFEEKQYDMKAPFNRPYQKLTPDKLSHDDKIYLCGKLETFKGTKNKKGKVFSEIAFLELRLVKLFSNPDVNQQFFMSDTDSITDPWGIGKDDFPRHPKLMLSKMPHIHPKKSQRSIQNEKKSLQCYQQHQQQNTCPVGHRKQMKERPVHHRPQLSIRMNNSMEWIGKLFNYMSTRECKKKSRP